MTEPTMPELAPCPFCGSPAELTHDSDHHGEWFNLGCSQHWHRVDPDKACPAGLLWYTAEPGGEAKAIAAWNRRALPADPPAEWIEAMARAIDPHGCNWENQLTGPLKDFARQQARAAYAALARRWRGGMLSEVDRCPTCGGEGDVPALIETPTGPVACPYIGEPCPDCGGTGKRALAEAEGRP